MRALLLAVLAGLLVPSAAAAAGDNARYALANGCYSLSAPGGVLVGKDGAGGYKAGAAPAEPIRMQATALGHYLLYGKNADFMAGSAPHEGETQPGAGGGPNRHGGGAGPGQCPPSP